jgi:hypothetical protein
MKRARGGKRTSGNKIAEVSTSKSKKRAEKALADSPGRAEAQKLIEGSFKPSGAPLKQSRLEGATH